MSAKFELNWTLLSGVPSDLNTYVCYCMLYHSNIVSSVLYACAKFQLNLILSGLIFENKFLPSEFSGILNRGLKKGIYSLLPFVGGMWAKLSPSNCGGSKVPYFWARNCHLEKCILLSFTVLSSSHSKGHPWSCHQDNKEGDEGEKKTSRLQTGDEEIRRERLEG